MARLRNRIVKADYWSDGDLLQMPREKRETYRGLFAVAEDSGCLEDNPFTWKLLLWPGPLDVDITVELLAQWRDDFVAQGKLVPYWVEGRRYFFIKSFPKHEHPRNPQKNDLPLPLWISWVPHGKDDRKGSYQFDDELLAAYIANPEAVIQRLNKRRTKVVQGSYNAPWVQRPLPCPALPLPPYPPELKRAVENLLHLAATVTSRRGSWIPKTPDAEMFAALLERYPAVQLEAELQKFKAAMAQTDRIRFGRLFLRRLDRVEPDRRLGSVRNPQARETRIARALAQWEATADPSMAQGMCQPDEWEEVVRRRGLAEEEGETGKGAVPAKPGEPGQKGDQDAEWAGVDFGEEKPPGTPSNPDPPPQERDRPPPRKKSAAAARGP
ncbi:MAG: hypothetical protein JW820_18705 [Spirochaetales bacterium]|nr:hypothetical protein [Spirochaetales bacterium]